MRPATAVSKKSRTSARSIWKKYESIKPEKHQFYCFKTISQILDSHHTKNFKDDKKQIYYHKINSPPKQYKENHSFKQNTQKKVSAVINRNPTIKKVLSNNFFSSKQIGKENTDYNSMVKIRTENKIDNQPKFLPYRQQSISIIKHSKILNEPENVLRDQDFDVQKGLNTHKPDSKASKKQPRNKVKQKTYRANDCSNNIKKCTQNSSKQNREFLIEQWQNFEQEVGTFSILMNNGNKLN